MTKGLTTYLTKNRFWAKTNGVTVVFATSYFILRTSYLEQDAIDDLEEDCWYAVENGKKEYTTGRVFEEWMKNPVMEMEIVKDTGCVMKLENGTEVHVLVNIENGENVLVDKKLFKIVSENTDWRYLAVLEDKRSAVFLLDENYVINGLVLPVRSYLARYKVVRIYDDSRLD